ncbi:MAG: NADH-quinone oxidoreductase subunit K [Desulfitobacteriaceae bacterium]
MKLVLGQFQGLLNSIITLILVTCFLVVGRRRLDSIIQLVVLQAFLLVALSLTLGWMTGNQEMYMAAFLTLLVKAGIIPYILKKVVQKVGIDQDVRSYVNRKMSYLISGALVIVSYLAAGQVMGNGSGLVREALPTAIAMLLIGLFIMMTRKRAIMQIIGFILMENGLFLAGVGTTNGMPLVIELGIFFDMLIGVLVMGILAFRINQTFDTTNTEKLKNLRG